MATKQQAASQSTVRPTIAKVEPSAAITRRGIAHSRTASCIGGTAYRAVRQSGSAFNRGGGFLHRGARAGIGDDRGTGGGYGQTARASFAKRILGFRSPTVCIRWRIRQWTGKGNVYSTFSGSRGQKSPVSIYKIDTNYNSKPFVTDLMNPTGLAFDREGLLYVSSRYDGIVYQVTPTGNMSVYVEGMGVATGIAFDREENLYVGDRSGTIFKISRSRQIYVFATLEPSIAAYHLAFGPEDYLYVSGPTTSSFDSVFRISKAGEVETFYRGLGRPQGIAFDADGRLYIAASLAGRRGIIRIDKSRKPEQFLSGPGIVGLAFTPSRAMILATHNALFRVDVEIAGRPLP